MDLPNDDAALAKDLISLFRRVLSLPSERAGKDIGNRVVARKEAMITAHRWDCILKGIGWLAGVVDALVLMAAVLILIPRHVLALDGGAHVLLALYLANWLYILAVVALALTIIWLVIKAKTVCRQATL